MEEVKPLEQHRWLQQLVGEWTYEGEQLGAAPGAAAEKWTGTENVRMLGELWALCEATGDTPGGVATSQLMLGYDVQAKRYTGSFVSSMMTLLWVYDDGQLDDGRQVLSMMADGPDFTDASKTRRYRDVFTIKGPDERVLEAYMQDDGGQWQPFMRTTYRRKK